MNIEPANSHESFNQIKKYIENKQLVCVYLNIRSLRKNFNNFLIEIKEILDEIDIIILVETNISDDERDFYKIEGFSSEHRNREMRRGGGIAIYLKTSIGYEVEFPDSSSYESMLIKMKINGQILSILAVYRPPGKTNIQTYISEIKRSIIEKDFSKNLIIVGDINIDMNKTIKGNQLYLDFISSSGLQSCNNMSTREDTKKNTSTNIDHVLVRFKSIPAYIAAGRVETDISDHYSLFFTVDHESKLITKADTIKEISRIDNEKAKLMIAETDWSNVMKQKKSEQIYEEFTKKMLDIYDKATYVQKPLKSRRPYPWMTKELLQLCKVREELYKKWKKNQSNNENENSYKSYRNYVNKKIRNEKNSYYKTQFNKSIGDMRQSWRLINEILGRPKKNNDDQVLKNINEDATITSNKLADSFNDQVQSVVHLCNHKCLKYSPTPLNHTIFIEMADEQEVLNILKNLNVNKSAGIDGIRAIDLKSNAELFAPIMTKLINSTITESNIPDKMKTAIIRPIYKSGKKSDMSNYRPVSILPIMEKIMEEVIVRRINNFVTKYKIINKRQYGFQAGKSINRLLGDFSSHLNESKGKKMHSIILFIDFKKAFDTLDHNIMVSCLQNIGIRGLCLEWIRNYLKNRSYKVKISDKTSKEVEVMHGVPQGSKLGPLLYLLYTNNIFNVMTKSTVFAYADDLAIVINAENLDEAIKTTQYELDQITKWSHDHKIIINAKKTKVMHIPPYNEIHKNIDLHIMNEPCKDDTNTTKIETVTEMKYLGIVVDNNANWKKHIDYIRAKLRKTIFFMYHLKRSSNSSIMKRVYFALAEPHIRFGITAWGSAKYCNVIVKLQNKIVRFLHKDDKNNILSIKKLYKMTMINTYYNSRKDYLKKINHNHHTRQKTSGKFETPIIKNSKHQQTLENVIPHLFNELPEDLTNIKDPNKRKTLLKKFFLNNLN